MGRNTVIGKRTAGGEHGFTLLELLVVMSIIVVLASIGIATYATSITRAKEATLHEDLFRLRDALDQYNADKGHYPADLQTLVTDGYVRQIPKDPFTDSADTWQTEMDDADPANPTAAPGVKNVKSGAQGTALDGESYSDF